MAAVTVFLSTCGGARLESLFIGFPLMDVGVLLLLLLLLLLVLVVVIEVSVVLTLKLSSR